MTRKLSGWDTTMYGENSDSTDIRIRWERRAVKEAASLQMPDRVRVFAAVEDLRNNR